MIKFPFLNKEKVFPLVFHSQLQLQAKSDRQALRTLIYLQMPLGKGLQLTWKDKEKELIRKVQLSMKFKIKLAYLIVCFIS